MIPMSAQPSATSSAAPHRLLAIVTDVIESAEEINQIRARAGDGRVAVHLVAPAVEDTVFRHTLGDVDEPSRLARERVEASLRTLRREGIEASGNVGDPDPVLAAEDALREGPADEVLIFEHDAEQARWFEDGLFERAQEQLDPPLWLVVVHRGADGEHVVAVERAGRGLAEPHQRELNLGGNLPSFSLGDLAGMVFGVVGTIVAIVLAAAAGPGDPSGDAAILIAIGVALVNMAHVVGLTLFESVRYRGGFERFFRTLALIGTPAAIVANLVLLLVS
jgi:hypothetical protein